MFYSHYHFRIIYYIIIVKAAIFLLPNLINLCMHAPFFTVLKLLGHRAHRETRLKNDSVIPPTQLCHHLLCFAFPDTELLITCITAIRLILVLFNRLTSIRLKRLDGMSTNFGLSTKLTVIPHMDINGWSVELFNGQHLKQTNSGRVTINQATLLVAKKSQ